MYNMRDISIVASVLVGCSLLLVLNNQLIITPQTKVQTVISASADLLAQSCMSNESSISSLRHLINSTRQVVVVMPAKAAGSSMKYFTYRCNDAIEKMVDNFLNAPAAWENLLTNSHEMPGVIASHILAPQKLVDIIRNVPRDTLLIYSHRQETSRLRSAVKYVLQKKLCSDKPPNDYAIEHHGLQCSISEKKSHSINQIGEE
jgi:hypothetical protein